MKRIITAAVLLLSVATLSAQSLKSIGNKLANQAEQFTFKRETVDTVFAVYWEDGEDLRNRIRTHLTARRNIADL